MNAFKSTLLIAVCLVASQNALAQSGQPQVRLASADPYFTPAVQPVAEKTNRDNLRPLDASILPSIPDLEPESQASPDEQVFVSHSVESVKPLPSIENSIIRESVNRPQTHPLPTLNSGRTHQQTHSQPNPFFRADSSSAATSSPTSSDSRINNPFATRRQKTSAFAPQINQEDDRVTGRTVTKKAPIKQDNETATLTPKSEFTSTSTASPKKMTDAGNGAAEVKEFEAGRVLALVGGEPVFAGDLIFEANKMIEQVMPTAPESVKAKQRPMLMKRLLPRFVEAKILYMATIRSLPAEADIEQILEQASGEFDSKALPMMMEKSGIDNPVQYDAHLRAMGSSLRQMRRTWSKEQLMRFFLAKQLQVDEEVTHQDMLDYYNEHVEDYAIPARVRWEQVVAKFSKRPSPSEAKKAIVEMGNQIVYGAKFDSVAKKMSDGYQASEGGQHDWTTKNALKLKVIDEALFTLPIGELSDIIESSDGYHILRVIEREEATKTSFLEAQIEIKQKLSNARREKAFQDHIAKVKEQIPVEIFEDALAGQ